MKTNMIITIGRQYGSGGHEIGKKVAEALGIKLYDKEMLARAAKESGFCEEILKKHDERTDNSFLYSLIMDTYSAGYRNGSSYMDMPINHKIFLAQFDTIKNIASEGPCVLIGRCADYALKTYPNLISVFIHADLDTRIARIAQRHDLAQDKARDLIIKTDKKRASYYNYYTDKHWSDATSYELCLDSSKLGINGTVQMIQEYAQLKEQILTESIASR